MERGTLDKLWFPVDNREKEIKEAKMKHHRECLERCRSNKGMKVARFKAYVVSNKY